MFSLPHTYSLRVVVLVILLGVLPVCLFGNLSDDDDKKKKTHVRPYKIGLVLSGGGAKGMAHVGVLRVLEEEGIRPDYITGTSMGSIVGGLYSLGFSVDSIESMMRIIDWDAVLSNTVSMRYMNSEEKIEYDRYILEFPIVGVKPKLPSGAIKGHELELLLSKLTCSALGIQDFDDLPIPFRAVATDMLTGKEFVFYRGDLSLALRASMSIPTIMEPVRYKGMLLVDGGLVNNFPVEICKEMGADIIIGSYTGGQLIPEDRLNNMYNLLKQSSLLMGIKDAEIEREYVDIYIEPELDDLSVTEFNRHAEFLVRGYKAASEERQLLKKLHRIVNEQEGYSPLKMGVLVDSIYVVSSNVKGVFNIRSKQFANRFLKLDSGRYYHINEIKTKIDRLYGTRFYGKINYRLVATETGTHVQFLLTEGEAKKLKFGVNYTNESKVGVNLAFELRNFVIPGSKFLLKSRFSEYPAVKGSYFVYFGKKGNFGIKYNAEFITSDIPLYMGNVLVSNYRRTYSGAYTEFQFIPTSRSSTSVSVITEGFTNNPKINNSNLAVNNYSQTSNALQFSYFYNSFDRKHYPYKGNLFNLHVKEHWASEYSIRYHKDSLPSNAENPVERKIGSYPNLIAKFHRVNMINEKWASQHDAFAAVSMNNGDVELNSFLLGGVNAVEKYQIPFWGLPENYTFFNNGFVYRFSMRYEAYENVFITGAINGAFLSNDYRSFMSDIEKIDQYYLGYGIDFGYLSPIGPIAISFTNNTRFTNVWTHFRLSYFF